MNFPDRLGEIRLHFAAPGEKHLATVPEAAWFYWSNAITFYIRNGKLHKKSIQDGHTVGPSSNRWKA